jgi:hypothetical protein
MNLHNAGESVSSTPPTLRFVDGVNFLSRSDFYSTGENISSLVQSRTSLLHHKKSKCEWTNDTAAPFVLNHGWTALMDGPRNAVQKYGFVVGEKPAPGSVLEQADFGAYESAGNDYYDSKKPMFRGKHSDELEIYESRQTVAYDCVCLTLVSVVTNGSEAESQEVSQYLVNLTSRHDVDVAALLDLMPLLGILDNKLTLSRVTELLKHPDTLVREKACTVLGEYRFQMASPSLLAIFFEGPQFLRDCSSPRAADERR